MIKISYKNQTLLYIQIFNLMNQSQISLEPFCEYFKDFVDDENRYTDAEYQELIKRVCIYNEFIKDHKWIYTCSFNTYRISCNHYEKVIKDLKEDKPQDKPQEDKPDEKTDEPKDEPTTIIIQTPLEDQV